MLLSLNLQGQFSKYLTTLFSEELQQKGINITNLGPEAVVRTIPRHALAISKIMCSMSPGAGATVASRGAGSDPGVKSCARGTNPSRGQFGADEEL